MADAAEEDDVIPKIKSSHLNLDDIPMELLPTHQEKIMKQVLHIAHSNHVQQFSSQKSSPPHFLQCHVPSQTPNHFSLSLYMYMCVCVHCMLWFLPHRLRNS